MTTSSARPTGAHVCAHCDDSTPHEHVDTRAVVDDRRTALLRLGLVRAGLAVAVVVLILVRAPTGGAATAVAAGAGAWALCTLAGLAGALLVGALLVGRGSSTVRRALVGALVGAATTPVAAWLLSLVLSGGWWVPVGAAAGWLAATSAAEAARVRGLRTLLAADTRAGEVARDAVVRLRETTSDRADLAWALATAAVFGLWVLACSLLAPLVLVAVPLQVVLVAVTRRHGERQRPAS